LSEAGRLVFLPLACQDENSITITECLLRGSIELPAAHCRLMVEESAGILPITGANKAVMDAKSVKGELAVRGWRPGDRYRPLGAPGSRKLQDIFVDAGVPRRWRNRIPIITDADGIIWIAGFRLADRVKITATTSRSLQLSIEWEFNPWTVTPSYVAPA
jgi:tRNA(Ile)-lysidine synthetase-like protein